MNDALRVRLCRHLHDCIYGVLPARGVVESNAMIVLLLALLAQVPEPIPRLICTTVNTPVYLGTNVITVEMKCCPDGSHIDDENHPADDKGNLICSKEKA